MPEPVVVHPLGITVMRAYLLEHGQEHLAAVATRIGTSAPAETADPRFPAIRLTELSTTEIIPRVWTRMLFQADCWGTWRRSGQDPLDQRSADLLGRSLVAVLRASANFITAGAVMGETVDLVVRPEPDTSLTPTQPRAIVTGHAWIRPN